MDAKYKLFKKGAVVVDLVSATVSFHADIPHTDTALERPRATLRAPGLRWLRIVLVPKEL